MSLSLFPVSWPPVILGLIMGLYWLKVLHLVARTKRTQGRAANFIPPEPLGRFLRLIWIPVVILWIFLPMATPFVSGLPWLLTPLSFPGNLFIGWLAAAVALAAFVVTWVCWNHMGTSWRMGIDPNERTRLIFNGPYAYVRHPIYGLSQILMLMTLIALPSPLMLLIAALHVLFMQWEVRREEKYLVLLHGTAYAHYMRHVGRFLPKIGSRVQETAWK